MPQIPLSFETFNRRGKWIVNDENVIPATYEQWRNCIEVHCNIPLTQTYIGKRLTELQDGKHPKTREFAKRYGTDHLQRIIVWFHRAADEFPGEQG